jgi:hypothetical protein
MKQEQGVWKSVAKLNDIFANIKKHKPQAE